MLESPRSAIAASALRFLRDEGGATSIEYAMIASGIGVVLAATIVNLGSTVKGMYSTLYTSMH
jgi:pilus assembly protein Flp/PilA